MTKYLINRILRGIGSVIIVVGVVMILIYSCMDRDMIFVKDPLYTKQMHNAKEVYKMQQWEDFGYLVRKFTRCSNGRTLVILTMSPMRTG